MWAPIRRLILRFFGWMCVELFLHACPNSVTTTTMAARPPSGWPRNPRRLSPVFCFGVERYFLYTLNKHIYFLISYKIFINVLEQLYLIIIANRNFYYLPEFFPPQSDHFDHTAATQGRIQHHPRGGFCSNPKNGPNWPGKKALGHIFPGLFKFPIQNTVRLTQSESTSLTTSKYPSRYLTCINYQLI